MNASQQLGSTSKIFLRPRNIVLFVLWTLPIWLYVIVGVVAVFQIGWFPFIAITLPILWTMAWLVARLWKPPHFNNAAELQPMQAPTFWSPRDVLAMEVVEKFRRDAAIVDWTSIADPNRYQNDAQELASLLAAHYYSANKNDAFAPLTLVEIFAVIHLAVEDLEQWILENVPGGQLVTVGLLQDSPALFQGWDVLQKLFFVTTTLTNPTKLLSYPLWRLSGAVTVELQNEVIRLFYQQYLRLIGYYLIEMYSGRLKGGSQKYRQQFGHAIAAIQKAGGNTSIFEQLEPVDTTIAVMGQVKAGKSSLINRLMQDNVAKINILPETREVKRYVFALPNSDRILTLLDSPGYSEADVSKAQIREIEKASVQADVVLLVMAANSPARENDVRMLRELDKYYHRNSQLKPPVVLAVLTHIDLLRPLQEWSPPYQWRTPGTAKEQSIANAVAYCRELFGDAVSGYACVCTGGRHEVDSSVADEVIPLLVEHLGSAQSTAILKAFYRQLSQQRYQQLIKQFSGLFQSISKQMMP